MRVTVVLCTFNRAHLLGRALESVAQSEVPNANWDVLVVDNNSSDQTREVVQQYASKYPNRFRYIFEPRPGKSFALNTGIANCDSDVLAFMDDDVTVEPSWLHMLTRALEDGRYAGAGGRIRPLWSIPVPDWLPADKPTGLAPLASFDLGDQAGELFEPPFGTNMAFRREVFEKYGLFRTDLGPRPDSEMRSEDTEFGARLLRNGERFWYEPAAVVYHPVPLERVNKRYYLTWWYDKGRADVREAGLESSVPLYLFRRLAAWVARWTITLREPDRFDCKLKVWTIAGQIVESLRMRRSYPRARA